MATISKKTKITATQSHTEQRQTIKRYKISSRDCEAIESLKQPFVDDYDVYLFLMDNGSINLARATHLRVVAADDSDLTRLEQRYKYAVSDLITRTNYRIYQRLYEQAQSDPDKLVDYLKLYDRREREQTAKAKQYRGKPKDEDSKGDFNSDSHRIFVTSLLNGLGTPSNQINIPTQDNN